MVDWFFWIAVWFLLPVVVFGVSMFVCTILFTIFHVMFSFPKWFFSKNRIPYKEWEATIGQLGKNDNFVKAVVVIGVLDSIFYLVALAPILSP
ncbi:hypothetical protein OA493_01480 [Gammaproteobacteria bacterium]|nr:hypothetical protein [Gammaproteobacteria bacterium]